MDAETPRTLHGGLGGDLLKWALVPYVVVGLGVAFSDPSGAPPPSAGGCGLLILALAVAIWVIRSRRVLACWLLALGSLLLTLLAQRWFPDSGAYQAMAYPIVASAIILRPKAAIAMTIAAAGVLGADLLGAGPRYNPAAFAAVTTITLVSTLFLISVTEGLQKSTIAWAWQSFMDARANLEMARDRQVELKQALEDLDLANREMVRLNDLLRAAREAVEEARRAKEEFVANVSHELRTPLNMIIGFSDEILERPEVYADRLPADLLDDVAAIKRNSEHLPRLVDDVLDLVEADAGFTRLTREWTSFGVIAEEAREAMGVFFAKKKLQLTMDLPQDLPPIYCDHGRIRQVLLNILSNAARFTQRGGAWVKAFTQSGMLTVSVSDTGPGMDPAVCNRLFEPFQQADPSIRRRYGGTGLGLAISKRFIALHGGKIWIESAVGVGTTVSFSLPLGVEPSQPAARRWSSPYQTYEARSRVSLAPNTEAAPRILVVEQGQALTNLLHHYLDGIEVTTVHDVQEAAEVMKAEPARALLINQIPSGNAGNSPSNLPSLAFDVPIITCWVPDREVAIDRMGVQDYLMKPIRRDDLVGSIARAAPQARRILLVEDDDEAHRLFLRMLSSSDRNYSIAHAQDGEGALMLMRTWQPDLVLLDLIIPGMNGFEVLACRASDDRLREIPVVIISARNPQRELIMSNALVLTRQQGLSARDLMLSVAALVGALPPRFGAATRREIRAPLPVSG
jgi:signal transduction histidine kinase/CheY-like chemotaxis protein